MMRIATLVLCMAALAGCEEATRVGSACPNGACPEALVRDDDSCTVTTGSAEIAIHTDGESPWSFPGVCLPGALERGDDGLVLATVYYLIGSGTTPRIGCTDRPFLKPVSGDIRAKYLADNPGAELCELTQLAVVAADGGTPTIAAGDGFYYDDFSADAADGCIQSGIRMTITEAARPLDGVIALFSTAEKRRADGEIDPSISCEPIRGTEQVGTACSQDRSEYDDSQAVISTRDDDCGQGICMAYHLDGEVGTLRCEPGSEVEGGRDDCASQAEVTQRMYCTCRCDGPPGSGNLCDCPDGFSCVDVVPDLVPDLAGGYCVKNGQLVD